MRKAIALALALCVVLPAGLAGAATKNPSVNIAPDPDFTQVCAAAPYSASCAAATLQAIDNARAQEGLGPMGLRSNFGMLPAEEQLLILADRERVDRGLRPFVGTVSRLNVDAAQGAAAAADPSTNVPYGGMWRALSVMGETNEVLAADYYWLYYDGAGPNGTINGDCDVTTGRGCWSHRDAILDPFTGLRTLIMGAATAPAPSGGNTVFSIVFVGTNQPAPALRFTWKKAGVYP